MHWMIPFCIMSRSEFLGHSFSAVGFLVADNNKIITYYIGDSSLKLKSSLFRDRIHQLVSQDPSIAGPLVILAFHDAITFDIGALDGPRIVASRSHCNWYETKWYVTIWSLIILGRYHCLGWCRSHRNSRRASNTNPNGPSWCLCRGCRIFTSFSPGLDHAIYCNEDTTVSRARLGRATIIFERIHNG
jgi:hypothetical protein